MQLLRDKNLSNPINPVNSSCRKRKECEMVPTENSQVSGASAKKPKIVPADPNVNSVTVEGEKWDAKKSKYGGKLKQSMVSIETLLMSHPTKSSTPVRKVEASKSSNVSEVNVSEMPKTSPSASSSGHSPSRESFDSTASWFMLNVNSYCEMSKNDGNSPTSVKSDVSGLIVETSSFLMHVSELSKKEACEFVSQLLDKIVCNATIGDTELNPTLPLD